MRPLANHYRAVFQSPGIITDGDCGSLCRYAGCTDGKCIGIIGIRPLTQSNGIRLTGMAVQTYSDSLFTVCISRMSECDGIDFPSIVVRTDSNGIFAFGFVALTESQGILAGSHGRIAHRNGIACQCLRIFTESHRTVLSGVGIVADGDGIFAQRFGLIAQSNGICFGRIGLAAHCK